MTKTEILKFAIAIGIEDREYLASLRDLDGPEVPAPPTFYIALGLAAGRIVARSELGSDGLPEREVIGTMKVTAGESSVQIHDRIRSGDRITVAQLAETREVKSGRSGDFTLQTLERTYKRSDGVTLVSEKYIRILR